MRDYRELIHQMQPTSTSCTSACMAMLLNRPVEQVVEEFHDPWTKHETDPERYLEPFGIECKTFDGIWGTLAEPENLYLLTVPSLNKPGHLHHVLLDLRGDLPVVFDPNRGRIREGLGQAEYQWPVNYYIPWDETPKHSCETKLTSWIIDAEIIL